jgi:hypothetical protein
MGVLIQWTIALPIEIESLTYDRFLVDSGRGATESSGPERSPLISVSSRSISTSSRLVLLDDRLTMLVVFMLVSYPQTFLAHHVAALALTDPDNANGLCASRWAGLKCQIGSKVETADVGFFEMFTGY